MSSADEYAEFTDTCNAIRRNDPSITWLNVESLPPGYGYELGEALVGNNHVSQLDIILNDLLNLEDPGVDPIMPLATYIATSETLRIVQIWAEFRPREMDSVPLGLYAHPTLLEFDFRIQREDTVDYVNVLSGLIRSTTVLKKLSLNGLYLDADGTETIVDALSANESIAKLSLLYCTFAIERGGQLLRKYLSSQPRLRELCVRGDTRRLEDAGIYANTARLLDTQSIDIESLSDIDREDLASYIPGYVRLRHLTLAYSVFELDHSALALAVRKNGSLHTCRVGSMGPFNDELGRVEVYCERNKRLPELLVEHRQNESNEASDFASFPPFFTVARHAPRTAPNALLSGLLTTSISLSGKATPAGGVKRAAASPSNRCTKKRKKAELK